MLPGLKSMAATTIAWLWLPIVKSRKNATKWVDANQPGPDVINLFYP
jgi:hypothetical protein